MKETSESLPAEPHSTDEPVETPSAMEDVPLRSDRRRFLAAGAATVAGVALAGRAAAQEGEKTPRPTLSQLEASLDEPPEGDDVQVLDASTYFQELPEARVISSHEDIFDATIESTEIQRFVPSPKGLFRFQARTYGSEAVAPQLRVRPGQTLRLRFVNTHQPNPTNPPELCKDPPDHNTPNCLNTTNVHTHGLHVSPNEPSDDVFLQVWPKGDPLNPGGLKDKDGSFDYVFQIPRDHAPGTHWYHAHRHGSTAFNVGQGQFGSLIVEEPPDQRIMPEGVVERTLVLAEALHEQRDDADLPQAETGRTGPLFTVNGANLPTIRMRPGEIQRWRMISASGTRVGYNPLSFPEAFRLWLVAWDGITLSGPPRPLNPKFAVTLAPGNRADILIQAPSHSSYGGELVRLGTDHFRTCDDPGQDFPNPGKEKDTGLASIVVSGTPAASPPIPRQLPASKSDYLRPITDAEVARSPKRWVTFDVTGKSGTKDRFRVGYRDDQGVSYPPAPYSPDFSIRVPYGNVEEWTIENDADQDHPFHIHVNPFQIVEVKEKDSPARRIPLELRKWSDTVNVPRRGHVKIRSRFVDFRGRYVLHCHILNHEDRGMMMDVEVV